MKKEFAIGLLILVVAAFTGIENPRFFTPYNLQNMANLVGLFGIFSIGMGIVIITGGIDLSVGSAFALQGVLLSMMLRQWNFPWPLAALGAVLLMVVLGLFHAFMITKVKLQPFIVTLCGLLLYRGLARYISNDETKGFGSGNFGWLRPISTGSLFGLPSPFIILIIVGVIMWIVLHRSVYGRYLYAVGRNEEAARYSGINTNLVIGSAYVVSMILAAISGILFAFWTNSVQGSNFGTNYELLGIAAAVLGGCSLRGGEGSIIGIIFGAILLQLLRNLVNLLGIQSSLDFAVTGGVILIGVTVDQVLSHRKRRARPVGAAAEPRPFPVVTAGAPHTPEVRPAGTGVPGVPPPESSPVGKPE